MTPPPAWAVASIDFLDAVYVDWAYHFRLQPIPHPRWQPADDGELHAVLEFAGRDYRARLTRVANDDSLDRLRVTLNLDVEDVPLPFAAVKLFNLLTEACVGMAKPELIPDPDSSKPRISLVGVSAEVAVESLSARTLRALLVDLSTAADSVEKQLDGEDVDHWEIVGGGEEHESGDLATSVFEDGPDADE